MSMNRCCGSVAPVATPNMRVCCPAMRKERSNRSPTAPCSSLEHQLLHGQRCVDISRRPARSFLAAKCCVVAVSYPNNCRHKTRRPMMNARRT